MIFIIAHFIVFSRLFLYFKGRQALVCIDVRKRAFNANESSVSRSQNWTGRFLFCVAFENRYAAKIFQVSSVFIFRSWMLAAY